MRRRSHPADLTDLHILVVEDNELNLEIAVFSLEAAGLNVSTAINGLEAVQLFEKSKPYEYDIILMDIMMPVMNGLDAAKAIRGLSRPDAPTVPIIALSANAFAEDIQKSKNAGINEHLAKPLEMDKVLKVIASYCKKQILAMYCIFFQSFCFIKNRIIRRSVISPIIRFLFYLHLKCFLYTVIMQKLSFCRKCLNFI